MENFDYGEFGFQFINELRDNDINFGEYLKLFNAINLHDNMTIKEELNKLVDENDVHVLNVLKEMCVNKK